MSRIIDPFDELAQLFLTDGEEDAAETDEASSAPDAGAAALAPIELLLVGHLPVRADLWLRPYAEAMAREVGTVALVRLDTDEPSVEALGAAAPELREDARSSLRETLRGLAPQVDLWILRPAGGAAPQAIVQAGGSRITIISSADEAALVAAYQRIKDLADAARAAGRELPDMGIAILGSPEPVAKSMVDRLNRTTRTFLGLELPLVAALRQMDAGSRSQAYARFLGERSPALDDVIDWLSEAANAPPALLPVHEAERALDAESAKRDPFDDEELLPGPTSHARASHGASAGHEPAPTRMPAGAQAARGHAASEAPRDAASADREVLEILHAFRHDDADSAASQAKTVKMAPKPVAMHEPKAASAPREPSVSGAPEALASFIEGLTPVKVRCPGHERVELALDAGGRFHLLCREDAMRELHLVEAWTISHRELLTMALAGTTIHASAAPVLHVITARPVSVADLHGSSLHLHVLTPVVVEGRTGWYAAPLNVPK